MTDEMELCDNMDSISEVATNDSVEHGKEKYAALADAQNDMGEHIMKLTMQNIEFETTIENLKRQYQSLEQSHKAEQTARSKLQRELNAERRSWVDGKRKYDDDHQELQRKFNEKNENGECKRLKEEIDILDSVKRNLELKLNERDDRIIELEKEKKRFDSELEHFTSVANSTNEMCKSMEHEKSVLEHGNATITLERDQFRKKFEDLTVVNASLAKKIEKLLATNKTLQGSLSPSALSPTFASTSENGKKPNAVDIKQKSRHASMEADGINKTDRERQVADEYRYLNTKYSEVKDRVDRKIAQLKEFKKKEEQWNLEKKKLQHKIVKLEEKKTENLKKVYEEINIAYKNEKGTLEAERNEAREERDLARKELQDARKELQSFDSSVKKLSVISSTSFAPLKLIVTTLREEKRLLKINYDIMKDEWVRNFNTLTEKIDELTNNRKNLEHEFNSLLPIVCSVVSKSHNLTEKCKHLKTENDRLSVAMDTAMATKSEKEEKMDVDDSSVANYDDEVMKLKRQIELMKAEKSYFEKEALCKQIKADDLETQLVAEQNKLCKIDFELTEAKQLLKEEKDLVASLEKQNKMVKENMVNDMINSLKNGFPAQR